MVLKILLYNRMNYLYNKNDPSYFNLDKFKKLVSKNLKNINESKKVYNELNNIDRKIISGYTHNTDMSDLIELLDDKRYDDILSYRILKYITGYHNVPSNAHILNFIESYINRVHNKSKILSKINQLITINYHAVIKLIQSLDSWKYISSNDITVYTGFNFEIPDIILANNNKYQNTVIHMINTEKSFTIPFFLSTTISPYVAKRFAGNGLVLKINIPKGNKFAYISDNNSKELEVLLNCGAILEKSETTHNESGIFNNVIEVTLIGYEDKNDRYYERLRDNYYNIIRKINSITNSKNIQNISRKRSRNNFQTKSKTRSQTRSQKGSGKL